MKTEEKQPRAHGEERRDGRNSCPRRASGEAEGREDGREKKRDRERMRHDKKIGEGDLDEQQQMQKRRRRRVQEWQDRRRKEEEEDAVPAARNEVAEGDKNEDEGEMDPLDAFMNSVVLPEVEKQLQSPEIVNATGRIIQGEDSDYDYGDSENEEDYAAVEDEDDDDEFMKGAKRTKVDKLEMVDHSKNQYQPFRKKFYIEAKEISRMTSEEIAVCRKELEVKIHGKGAPNPIKKWCQTGLSSKILDTIKKLNFEKPMPVQAQALPVIMSGRDCIGIAKTGSGKTLAFVLPMLRHIKDQPPAEPGDGPIALIMAPTRELVRQIHSDVKKFSKPLGVNCVAVYGGSGVAQQIRELKRGSEIVVCTPGRMIDMLCTSSGKITNLRRVTYLVMDEADRMFDRGFEPQIIRIVQNTRPNRQTVLFSATFPRQVEMLARKVLSNPVEIQVGGRSLVNKDITQLVEVRPESERFLRLLEILGEWYQKGKILVFVHSQDKCDALFRDLITHGYPCLPLHGRKEQSDRECTVSDFKSSVCNIMIATSVAARGLDVKELELVVNFDVPNHYEDYVHRVGRTGRAGRKGSAITFISQEEERFAPDLVKALELSEQGVPEDLKAIADGFMAKVDGGTERVHGTGYGGSGFKFNEEEDEATIAAKKAQAREYGFEGDKSDSEDEHVDEEQEEDVQKETVAVAGAGANLPADAAEAAAEAARAVALRSLAKLRDEITPEHHEAEMEINDFPQNARWRVTRKEALWAISEWTGAAITIKGQYFPPGKTPGEGERKLYLLIQGTTEASVRRAKAQVRSVLEASTS